MSNTITFNDKYDGFNIQASKAKQHGIILDVLRPMIGQITTLLSRHSRITVLRFDCRFPTNWEHNRKLENNAMTRTTKMIKENLQLKRWSGHRDLISGWVYEVGNDGRPHYHCFIGFKSCYRRLGAFGGETYSGIWELIRSAWKRTTGGTVHFSKNHTVNRTNFEQLNCCIHHISYMAKVNTKQFGNGSTAKNFSFSRLKSTSTQRCNQPATN